LIRPPRTHPMPKADTSLLGAIGRITGNTGGFSGTKKLLLVSRSKLRCAVRGTSTSIARRGTEQIYGTHRYPHPARTPRRGTSTLQYYKYEYYTPVVCLSVVCTFPGST
jgi:hypothetical protein